MIGIAGLGQIGGSIRAALGKRNAVGADPRVRSLPPLDLLVLACPMPAILEILADMRRWKDLPKAVTDVGSVKAPVVAAMRRLPPSVAWIGGHPLAGREVRVIDPDLFRGATWVLTKERHGDVRPVLAMVRRLGARPCAVPAARHDRVLARTSHLPYLVSCALVKAARRDGIPPRELEKLSAGGWRGMTRLAKSDPVMAQGYVRANAREVGKALRSLLESLEALKP